MIIFFKYWLKTCMTCLGRQGMEYLFWYRKLADIMPLSLSCHAVPLKCDKFSPISSQQIPRSLPVRARYGICVVSFKSGSCPASVIVKLSIKSWWTGPPFNGTWLYNNSSYCTISHHIVQYLIILCNISYGAISLHIVPCHNGTHKINRYFSTTIEFHCWTFH